MRIISRLTWLVWLILQVTALTGQGHGDVYLSRVDHGGTMFHYDTISEDIIISHFDRKYGIFGNGVFADKQGKYLAHFNGLTLFDSIDRPAINGEGFGLKGWFMPELYIPAIGDHEGYVVLNSQAFIPVDDSSFYLFNADLEIDYGQEEFLLPEMFDEHLRHTSYNSALYYTLCKLNKDGRIEVQEDQKEVLLLSGFFRGSIYTCKHANGSDWWLMMPNLTDDQLHTFLITENGIQYKHIQSVSDAHQYNYPPDFSNFSPNGNKLVRCFHRISENPAILPDVIEILDFDRCTGLFSNPIRIFSEIHEDGYGFTTGVCFSPNERFLYFANGPLLLQFDLHDPDFTNNPDTIYAWNGIDRYSGGVPTFVSELWRLPNGKIWVNFFNFLPWIHIIHHPDEKGEVAGFEYKAIELSLDPFNPEFHHVIPTLPWYYPPYRMPPLDVDCTTSTQSPVSDYTVSVYPNPFDSYVFFESTPAELAYNVTVYSMRGQVMHQSPITQGSSLRYIHAASWPSGVYVVVSRDDKGQIIQQQKIVKM